MKYTVIQSFSTTFQRFREGDEIDEIEIIGLLTKTQLAMLSPVEPSKVGRPRAPAAKEGEMKMRPAKDDEKE